MDIRMYDCGFGDCFRLTENEKEHLYVDFGIHKSSGIPNKDLRYDQIISDMPDKSDFLLTHYHFDHYSGAIYMANKIKAGEIKKCFNDVYIPDIWKTKKSVDVVILTLLRNLITRSVWINKMTLIDFLISICHSKGKFHFVTRNTNIQGKYVALWPDENFVNNKTDKFIESLLRGKETDSAIFQTAYGKMSEISEELCNLVRKLEETNEMVPTERTITRTRILSDLESLGSEFDGIASSIDLNENIKNRLFNYGNNISIVLQNQAQVNTNILFTGDLKSKTAWKLIENNFDGKIPMHDEYDVIKIPHHGTHRCYHSFVNKCGYNTTLLIPNGLIGNTSWYISGEYSRDANITNSTVICSDNKACKAASPSCSCKKCRLVSSAAAPYIDV